MLFIQFLFNLLLVKQTTDLLQNEFEKFIQTFKKPYSRDDPDEYFLRIKHFENSLRYIHLLNRFRPNNNHSAYYGLTKYSDLSSEEFHEIVLKNKRIPREKYIIQTNISTRKQWKRNNIPSRFDWRDHQVIGPVRDQGKCGACWAFSTASTIESMVAINAGNRSLPELSTQQLVDCSREDNQGCNGGDPCSTLIWMTKNNVSLELAKDYPTEDFAGECRSNPKKQGVRIKSDQICHSFVDKEQKIIELLANHGPLIATVDASTWQHYLGGIIQYHCFNDRNHAVQITGYDLTGPIPYYIVRNTWDVNFGIEGYVHIAIGNNLCGIAEEISSVDVQYVPLSFL